ncbi:MAG: helical backbone metal receptor [Pseudobdellovibrionaceae bacterium]|nr:helical backbone metal receptor [Pseudobdellovibrionaceae bacterium]
MNRTMRIVSLVPSLSETVCTLGRREHLVGCTHFCVEPKDLRRKAARIGGTKDPDLEHIRTLQPTHILANQEENPRDPVLELARDIPTLVTFPKGPADVPGMLRDIGHFLDCEREAERWADRIEELLQAPYPGEAKRFLYLIWQNPYMLVGRDTYISRTLESIGWINAYEGPERYPALDIPELDACRPDIILLSSEPYPFRKRDAERLKAQWPLAPRLARVDGQLLSWFGTRTCEALEQIRMKEADWLKDFSPLLSKNP